MGIFCMPNVGKIVTTRCVFSAGKCAKMRWRPGLRPGPRWGSLQRFPDPLAGLRGPTSKGRGSERRGGERGKGGEGTGGKGEGMGGKCPPSEILKTPLSVAVSFHF